MSGTKTGNKGLVNPVDGKVYTVDPVTKGEDGINTDPVSYDPGDMTVDQTVKDLGKKTKLTLGNYLSKMTKGEVGDSSEPNKYTIDAPTDASLESSLRTAGYPSPLTPASSGNSENFDDNLPSSLSEDFSALNKDGQKIKKGAANVDVPDGHTLLPTVKNQDSPIPTYQASAFAPNYRILIPFTTEDILSPSKDFDPELVKYDNLQKARPQDEAVVATDLGLKLADVFKTPQTLTNNAKNAYPVSIPDTLDLTQLAALTTNGYPSPLTVPDSQNAKVFTQNPGSSVSDDYAAAVASDGKITTLISKGKKQEKENEQLLDGNALLQNVKLGENSVVTLPGPLKSYYDEATNPNYRIPGAKFTTEDITSPNGAFDFKLLDYSNLQLVAAPGLFAPKSDDLTQTLAKFVKIPKDLSEQYKNLFPINTPNEENFKFEDLASISSPDGKYPADLTVPENQNGPNIFANPLRNSYSKYYTVLNVNANLGLQKGKTVNTADANPNGSLLLSNITIQNKEISNFDFLKSYIDSTLSDNEFEPAAAFLDSSVDLLNPAPDLEPKINDIPLGIQKGEYAGIAKDVVTVQELRQKASDLTYGKTSDGSTPNVAVKNKYAVSPPGDYSLEPRFAPITDLSTKSPPLLIDSANDEVFAKREQINPLSTDASLVDSGFFKGKNNPNQDYDGHSLLQKVDGNVSFSNKFKNANGRLDYHGSGLNETNYQPGGLVDGDESLDELSARTGNGVLSVSDLEHPLYKYKNNESTSNVLSFGNNRWAARARSKPTFNPGLKLSDGTVVSHLRMAKIGTGLLQRASGEIPAWTASAPPGGTGFNPTGDLAEAGALLPSVVQAGILKVSNQSLLASDVLQHLTAGEEEDPDALINIARGFINDNESWGAAYSSTEPYDEPGSAIGLALTMIIMVLAINLLYSLFLIGDNTRKTSRKKAEKATNVTDRDPQAKGKYIFVAPDSNAFMSFMPDPAEVFGLRKTNNSYTESVGYGVRAFFLGSEKADITFGEMALALLGIGLDAIIGEGSPMNANIVVCRTIVRSALVFAIAIDSIIRKFQSSVFAGVKAILGLLKVFRASKIIASLNVFATLGDALLDRTSKLERVKGEDGSTYEINPDIDKKAANNSIFDTTFKKVDIDKKANVLKTQFLDNSESLQEASIRKSRLTYVNEKGVQYNATLAWSAQRAPSLYLLPKRIENLSKLMNNKYASLPGEDSEVSRAFGVNTALKRIPNDIRDRFESMLEAEYVPFYFQDVRTNEIISFHAFLANLTDDYTASYDSVEGFGRVEPVKIYKGTTRKIGLQFWVVSTSPEDFTHMWYKINKLLTLVYPQYTAGRDLLAASADGSTNFQFKAPFSQMIGASPLIRIRLGDLLRSNYSDFAMAKLFGAADGDMVLPKSVNEADANNPQVIDPLTAVIESRDLQVNKTNAYVGSKLEVTEEMKKVSKTAFIPDTLKVTISSLNQDDTSAVAQLEPDNLWVEIIGKVSQDRLNRAKEARLVGLATTEDEIVLSGIPLFQQYPISSLKFSEDEIKRRKKEVSTSLADFINPENNAVIKSFKSAGGKGLAGFIETMSFDWYNQTTWEIGEGNTAPKMCKVNIAFTPVHDISPGIDQHGYNRAPVYRVGNRD